MTIPTLEEWRSDKENTAASKWVSPKQLAEILNVHHQTVRNWVRDGRIPPKHLIHPAHGAGIRIHTKWITEEDSTHDGR